MIGGFAFSAFQRDQSPFEFRFPTAADIDSDVALMSGYSRRARSYASAESDAIPEAAKRHGMELMAGAWIDRRPDNNERELAALISATQRYDNIPRVVVGNEVVLRSDLKPRELIRYLDRAREAIAQPVSTAEPWHVWLKYPELAEHVDFITVHLLPYWEGVPRRSSVAHVLRRYDEVRERFPDIPIVIGEVGWPSNGDRFRNSVASTANEARFIREFLREAKERDLDYYLMEAFDQPWKEAGEGRVGAYWGMFDAARQLKFPLRGPVVEDPAWRIKAGVATLLALLPMVLFAQRFRRFRLWGRVFFTGLIQAGVALLVWSFTLPFEFYLEPLDWTMLLVLVPAQIAILAILLINGFEFVEALAQRDWQRRFRPLDALPARPPKVSIHVPCHDEPPEMVMQTLDSLAALDYPDFEVLVIDNNTKDGLASGRGLLPHAGPALPLLPSEPVAGVQGRRAELRAAGQLGGCRGDRRDRQRLRRPPRLAARTGRPLRRSQGRRRAGTAGTSRLRRQSVPRDLQLGVRRFLPDRDASPQRTRRDHPARHDDDGAALAARAVAVGRMVHLRRR
jgi:exo-beta-1,3-glucanase (GH17 family)